MWIALNAESEISLSRQIYERIKHMILAGELTTEQKLPSSRTLSKELGIARNTVLEAYEQLLAEGYLDARHGSGTRVAKEIVPMRADRAPSAQCRPKDSRRTQEATSRSSHSFQASPTWNLFQSKNGGGFITAPARHCPLRHFAIAGRMGYGNYAKLWRYIFSGCGAYGLRLTG